MSILVPRDVINNLNEKKDQVKKIYKNLENNIIKIEEIIKNNSNTLNDKKNEIKKLEKNIEIINKKIYDTNDQIEKYNIHMKDKYKKIIFFEQKKQTNEKTIQNILLN
jgi:chromosome segregation ATPase